MESFPFAGWAVDGFSFRTFSGLQDRECPP